MLDRTALRAVAIATTVAMASSGAVAFDDPQFRVLMLGDFGTAQ